MWKALWNCFEDGSTVHYVGIASKTKSPEHC